MRRPSNASALVLAFLCANPSALAQTDDRTEAETLETDEPTAVQQEAETSHAEEGGGVWYRGEPFKYTDGLLGDLWGAHQSH